MDEQSIFELGEHMARRELTSRQLVEAYLERIGHLACALFRRAPEHGESKHSPFHPSRAERWP